jgi:hypothetical protein
MLHQHHFMQYSLIQTVHCLHIQALVAAHIDSLLWLARTVKPSLEVVQLAEVV